MKPQYCQLETKSYERVANGVKIKGFASTPDLDRGYDVVRPSAFLKSIKDFLQEKGAPALLRSHDPDDVVGSILMEGDDAPVIVDKGVIITALITEKKTAEQAEAGEVRTLSIGFIPTSVSYDLVPTGKIERESGQELYAEARIIEELDWVETSIVSTPANRKALFTVTKSLEDYFSHFPSPVMKHKCSYCPESEKNDAEGQIGTKFICKGCMNKVEYKGEVAKGVKPILDEEKSEKVGDEKPEDKTDEKKDVKVEAKEVPKTDKGSEKGGESPSKSGAEDVPAGAKSQEEEKDITPEQKAAISDITDVLLDVKTVEKEEKKEEKKVEEKKPEEKAAKLSTLDIVLPLMKAMAVQLKEVKSQNQTLLDALAKIPVRKGQTFASLQHSFSKDEKKAGEKKDANFVSFLKSAQSTPDTEVVISGGEDTEDDDA